MKKTLLRAKNLSKSYFIHGLDSNEEMVLKDVSLELKEGQSIAIVGKSGVGKSTLLHLLGTLEKADSGQLEINGSDCSSCDQNLLRQQSIGLIFQAFYLLEDFTALENVLMPAKIARRKSSREEGLLLLEKVGLQEKADQPVKFLSGGERQRVAIARALCNKPSLLLADEPTGNLDKANKEAIGMLLLSIVKKFKTGLILVTHDADLALLCDLQFCLEDGRLHPMKLSQV